MQIYGPLKLISLIPFINNNKIPPLTEENYWSPEIRSSRVQLLEVLGSTGSTPQSATKENIIFQLLEKIFKFWKKF